MRSHICLLGLIQMPSELPTNIYDTRIVFTDQRIIEVTKRQSPCIPREIVYEIFLRLPVIRSSGSAMSPSSGLTQLTAFLLLSSMLLVQLKNNRKSWFLPVLN